MTRLLMLLPGCNSAGYAPISKQNPNLSLQGSSDSSSGDRDSSLTVILGDTFLWKFALIMGMRLDVGGGVKRLTAACVEGGGVSQQEPVVNSLLCCCSLYFQARSQP